MIAAGGSWDVFRHVVRRHLGRAAAEVHRRHVDRFSRPPFIFARVLDFRLPRWMREEAGQVNVFKQFFLCPELLEGFSS